MLKCCLGEDLPRLELQRRGKSSVSVWASLLWVSLLGVCGSLSYLGLLYKDVISYKNDSNLHLIRRRCTEGWRHTYQSLTLPGARAGGLFNT